MAKLKELRQSRIDKLNKLRGLGINPFPSVSSKDKNNLEIHEKYDELENKKVVVAGRILSIREHGKIFFIDIKDQSGSVQLYIRQDEYADPKEIEYTQSELQFENFELLDFGDFIEAFGIVTKTKRGEISVLVKKLRILTKSIRPMPDSYDGLKDKETRLRRRYLDTNLNKDVFDRFIRRTKYWESNRNFLNRNGFLEMNIPVLEPVTGGADAKPFVTHLDALDQELYLRISQELYLKRLIGGGYEKVYEIGPRFRNEGLSDEHLPEHIALEFYMAYTDYRIGMEFVKEMFITNLQDVYGKDKKVFNIKGFEVDITKEWTKLDFPEIIKKYFDIDILNTNLDEVKNKLSSLGCKFDSDLNIPRGIDSLWKQIRKTISGPAFLINEPKYLSPLAKSKVENPELTERLHLVIAGSELGNGFSELNDPLDQYERFMEQQRMRDAGDEEAQMMDIDFVEMLEYGMPPTFGWGHTERVFWFFEDVTAREGVIFPQLRNEIDKVSKTIYPDYFKSLKKKKED